jgi:predicted transcriptional regulator
MAKRSELLDKKKVLASIRNMPDKFSVDDVVERMMLLSAIEEGMADVKAGRTMTLDEAKKHFAKWLK